MNAGLPLEPYRMLVDLDAPTRTVPTESALSDDQLALAVLTALEDDPALDHVVFDSEHRLLPARQALRALLTIRGPGPPARAAGHPLDELLDRERGCNARRRAPGRPGTPARSSTAHWPATCTPPSPTARCSTAVVSARSSTR